MSDLLGGVTCWFDVAAMRGIGRLYAGGCDRVTQLPPIGTPERIASDKRHNDMVRGLLISYETHRKDCP